VLPATARLRQRAEFTATLRGGRRGRSGLLAVHLDRSPASELAEPRDPARVGFVVSRAVGPAVVRNRVLRRLRHLMAARLDHLPGGSRVVVRAFPLAAAASSASLAAALDRALAQASGRDGTRPSSSTTISPHTMSPHTTSNEGQVAGR
jgi:ribonuclease P protein component